MAINLLSEYPGQVDPASPDYPEGTPKNDVVPGDNSGTPWEKEILKDIVGFQAALLAESGVTASGLAETALVSQYLEGVRSARIKEKQLTTLELIASTRSYPVGTVLDLSGFTSAGDKGGSPWQLTVVTGQPVSQSPAQLGDALLNDANGDQWRLIVSEEINPLSLGAKYDDLTDDSAAHDAALFALNAAGGGLLRLPAGTTRANIVNTFDKVDIIGNGRSTIIAPLFICCDLPRFRPRQ